MPPSLRSNTCVTSPRGPLVHDYASQACICQCTIIKAGFKFLTDRYLTCLNGAGSGPGPRFPGVLPLPDVWVEVLPASCGVIVLP